MAICERPIKNGYYPPLEKPHFSLHELFVGCTEIERKNALLSPSIVDNMLHIAEMLTILRGLLTSHHMSDQPIKVNSCYRDVAHNNRVGGVITSQHLTGSAVDFYTLHLKDAIQFIKSYLEFGQLVIYDNFLHLSLPDKKHLFHIVDKRKNGL